MKVMENTKLQLSNSKIIPARQKKKHLDMGCKYHYGSYYIILHTIILYYIIALFILYII